MRRAAAAAHNRSTTWCMLQRWACHRGFYNAYSAAESGFRRSYAAEADWASLFWAKNARVAFGAHLLAVGRWRLWAVIQPQRSLVIVLAVVQGRGMRDGAANSLSAQPGAVN